MGNSQPVIMDVKPADGTINKFISLENVNNNWDVVPNYKTYGAIYHEKIDSRDNIDNIYVSFLMDNKLEYLKINNHDDVVDFIYEFDYPSN